MSLPPLPKNFTSAVDLSSLGKPAQEAIATISSAYATRGHLSTEQVRLSFSLPSLQSRTVSAASNSYSCRASLPQKSAEKQDYAKVGFFLRHRS